MSNSRSKKSKKKSESSDILTEEDEIIETESEYIDQKELLEYIYKAKEIVDHFKKENCRLKYRINSHEALEKVMEQKCM